MSAATVLAALSAGAAVLVWTSAGMAQRRLVSFLGRRGVRTASAASPSEPPWVTGFGPAGSGGVAVARTCCSAVAGVGAAWLLQTAWGVPFGVLAGLAVERLLRATAHSRAARRRAERLSADLPVTADLLAACFSAGADPVTAVTAVADAVDGPVSTGLRRVLSLLALGADPAHAWGQLAQDRSFAPLATALVRATETGAPLAESLTTFADDLRHARSSQAQARAHRAGVYAVAPLGLCFLPAFLLLGVVPVVLGIAAPVLGLVLR